MEFLMINMEKSCRRIQTDIPYLYVKEAVMYVTDREIKCIYMTDLCINISERIKKKEQCLFVEEERT